MRKLKFTLNRKSLSQIYLSYVAPLQEYASIGRDGCSDSVQIHYKKFKNEAARIVTGLTRSVSLENLFLECGWQSLKDRRETQKNVFYVKSHPSDGSPISCRLDSANYSRHNAICP